VLASRYRCRASDKAGKASPRRERRSMTTRQAVYEQTARQPCRARARYRCAGVCACYVTAGAAYIAFAARAARAATRIVQTGERCREPRLIAPVYGAYTRTPSTSAQTCYVMAPRQARCAYAAGKRCARNVVDAARCQQCAKCRRCCYAQRAGVMRAFTRTMLAVCLLCPVRIHPQQAPARPNTGDAQCAP